MIKFFRHIRQNLLNEGKATLGKFNNVIRNFKGDIILVKNTEKNLLLKATNLIALLKKEYQ
jgi:hypothetical protein